jgi:hypothetical protein
VKISISRSSGVAGAGDDPVRADAEIQAGQQVRVPGLGEDELAVGQPDVPGQGRAASGRVQPDQDRAGQCRAAEREGELGQVVGQNADVERQSGPAQRGEGGRVGGGGADMSGPRPGGVLEPQA